MKLFSSLMGIFLGELLGVVLFASLGLFIDADGIFRRMALLGVVALVVHVLDEVMGRSQTAGGSNEDEPY